MLLNALSPGAKGEIHASNVMFPVSLREISSNLMSLPTPRRTVASPVPAEGRIAPEVDD